MTLSRRAMFGGLIGLAAPAIIRTPGLLMAVKPERIIWVTPVTVPFVALPDATGRISYSGPILDACARLIGLSRFPGESDADFDWRIQDVRRALNART